MKSFLSCAIAGLVLSIASVASAGQGYPTLAAPGYEVAPPVQSYHATPTYAAPVYAAPATRGLYNNVRVKDRRNIAPCAVKRVVSVADPCADGCCVDIEICAPDSPCPPDIRVSRKGRKVKYDYGKYEVEITSSRRGITVDYDD